MPSVAQAPEEFQIPRRQGKRGYVRLTLENMKVGDSHWFETDIGSASGNANKAGKEIGGKFRCRTEDMDGKAGVRIWRTL